MKRQLPHNQSSEYAYCRSRAPSRQLGSSSSTNSLHSSLSRSSSSSSLSATSSNHSQSRMARTVRDSMPTPDDLKGVAHDPEMEREREATSIPMSYVDASSGGSLLSSRIVAHAAREMTRDVDPAAQYMQILNRASLVDGGGSVDDGKDKSGSMRRLPSQYAATLGVTSSGGALAGGAPPLPAATAPLGYLLENVRPASQILNQLPQIFPFVRPQMGFKTQNTDDFLSSGATSARPPATIPTSTATSTATSSTTTTSTSSSNSSSSSNSNSTTWSGKENGSTSQTRRGSANVSSSSSSHTSASSTQPATRRPSITFAQDFVANSSTSGSGSMSHRSPRRPIMRSNNSTDDHMNSARTSRSVTPIGS
eukprot:TRINITY_DN7939_c0_g1_i2.p1 TRINITY_DN7939_c0_g1~~TRINITY_DN7939_c0_g1_i2.p1  ORF type:complete len:380 (-),score=64.65 TRINITY_DN7939_c0_g1_i2:60-1157(-)